MRLNKCRLHQWYVVEYQVGGGGDDDSNDDYNEEEEQEEVYDNGNGNFDDSQFCTTKW